MTVHLSRFSFRTMLLICLFIFIPPLNTESSAGNDRNSGTVQQLPSTGPWLECEDEYFHYVYKEADESFLADIKSVARESYETASGYLQCLPPVKPTVVLYGIQDEASVGGLFSPMPMHIALMANNAREFSSKTLLTHELTHYLQAERRNSGTIGRMIGFFAPDYDRSLSIFLSDLSVEGSTSFIDGQRRSERLTLPVRAAVLEGRMWNYNQVSSAGIRQPTALRVYLSGMLVQDWLFDTCGDNALIRILEERDTKFFALESSVFKTYTGLDFEVAWGDIRSRLDEYYSFARDLPSGVSRTPRDSGTEPQWGSLTATDRGYFHYRNALDNTPSLGFWRPDESETTDKKDEKEKRGLLAVDPGLFIPLNGLVSPDASISRDGSIVAAVITVPAKTSLYQDPNKNKLVLARVAWSADGKKAKAADIRYINGTGFSAPALSGDGKRLFALKRTSEMYHAYEIDHKTGFLTSLAIPSDISINRISISPDGKNLALSYIRGTFSDVGIYNLETGIFTPVTDDESVDFAAGFLGDGTFVFSSDRENTVAVYRFENGIFSRECIDRIAAWAPVEDGKGGYFYSSYSTGGRVIRQLAADQLRKTDLPSFNRMKPVWIERRDTIWETYRTKGQALAERGMAEKAMKVNAGESAPEDRTKGKIYLDIAKPYVWMPVFDIGYEGAQFGLGLAGISTLGTNSWVAQLAYIPTYKQLSGAANLSFSFPLFSATAGFNHDFYGTELDDSSLSWNQDRSYSLSSNIPLSHLKSASGMEGELQAMMAGVINEKIFQERGFTLSDSFGLPLKRNIAFYGGLAGSLALPRPEVSFLGGTAAGFSAQALLEKDEKARSFGMGYIGTLNAGFLVSPDLLITIEGGGAWREQGSAHELLRRSVPRWEGNSTAPLHGDIKLTLSNTALGPETANRLMSNELNGIAMGMKTFFEAENNATPVWLEEFELTYDHIQKITVYYTSFIIKIGAGYRFSIADWKEPVPNDFCLNIGMGTSLQSW